MRELLAELNTILQQGRPCVYCAVVETRGSTPQKAGAAMLVFPDGNQRGTLGGGCIEAEVKQRALRVFNSQDARADVLTFCLDDNYGWDDGLICGGRMTILADPMNSSGNIGDYYRQYHQLIDAGAGCTEVVALPDNPASVAVGTRYLFGPSNELITQLGEDRLPQVVVDHLTPLEKRPRAGVHKGFAHLPILPRVTVFIVGGGHVGQAVAELAAQVDFDIWVLDDRERYASVERFPMAQQILVGDIGRTLKEWAPKLNPSTYCLIVTRGHNHDEEALYHLAPTNAGYVGMIGSKRKIKLIYEDLMAKGISEEMLARVHAPLGFDIGSQTVPEIAISIVAELIACRNLNRASPTRPVRA